MNTTSVEILAALCGLSGTLLLATKGKWAGWGFVAFLASTTGWLAFAWHHDHQFMFIQQVGFTIGSLIGIWKWLIEPAIEARYERILREVTGL